MFLFLFKGGDFQISDPNRILPVKDSALYTVENVPSPILSINL